MAWNINWTAGCAISAHLRKPKEALDAPCASEVNKDIRNATIRINHPMTSVMLYIVRSAVKDILRGEHAFHREIMGIPE